jgi:hypothetical protein
MIIPKDSRRGLDVIQRWMQAAIMHREALRKGSPRQGPGSTLTSGRRRPKEL